MGAARSSEPETNSPRATWRGPLAATALRISPFTGCSSRCSSRRRLPFTQVPVTALRPESPLLLPGRVAGSLSLFSRRKIHILREELDHALPLKHYCKQGLKSTVIYTLIRCLMGQRRHLRADFTGLYSPCTRKCVHIINTCLK